MSNKIRNIIKSLIKEEIEAGIDNRIKRYQEVADIMLSQLKDIFPDSKIKYSGKNKDLARVYIETNLENEQAKYIIVMGESYGDYFCTVYDGTGPEHYEEKEFDKLQDCIDYAKKFKEKEITEVIKWASDGGYYDAPEHQIIVSPKEAELIKKDADLLYNQLFNGEQVAKIGPNEQLKDEIIQKLRKEIDMENDNEEDENYYWIKNADDIHLAKEEFKAIVDNLYDKVDPNMKDPEELN